MRCEGIGRHGILVREVGETWGFRVMVLTACVKVMVVVVDN